MKKFINTAATMFFTAAILSQNVGIGTATPQFKLDVLNGSINTDSVYRIGGQTVLKIKGSYNLFVGINSGDFLTTGFSNTGVGYRSLYNNTSGSSNTAMGFQSLWANSSGGYNTAYGNYANSANSTGSFNVSVGASSLRDNTTGGYNVANGYYAIVGNTSGTGNVGIGYWTLSQNDAANFNTAVGHEAGRGHLHGWNNTFVGSYSNAAGTGLYNCIAIGNYATATASNQVRIGNSSNNSIGGFANWTNISDGRFKKNVKEDVKGLDFILQLRPVTYQLDISGLRKKLNESDDKLKESGMESAIAEKENIVQTGFVAQEVEAIAKKLGFDFSGVDKPKNENDLFGLRYAEFVVPLVKAVQEQQKLIEVMQIKIATLERQVGGSSETTPQNNKSLNKKI